MVNDNILVKATEAFVRKELANNDASHDFSHIARVRATALSLGIKEKLSPEDLQEVEISSLLHDIDDWKYSGSEFAGSKKASDFLKKQGCSDEKCKRIAYIIQRIRFQN